MADIAFQQAVLLYRQGRPADAEKPLLRYAQRNPRDPDALHLLGIIAHETGRSPRAVSLIGKAIALNPNAPALYDSLANALFDLGRKAEALAACDKAIALDPRFVEALVNRGNILFALQRYPEALASHDRAIALAPGFAEAHFNRALALCELERREEALVACDTAIALRPSLPDVHFTRGNMLFDASRYNEALACFERVVALKPDHSEAWFNTGNTYARLLAHDKAVENFDRALRIDATLAGAWQNRGNALAELRRYADALTSYREALRLSPQLEFVSGEAIQAQLTICQWTHLDRDVAALARGIERGEKQCGPFTALAALADPSLQRRAAEIYAASKSVPGHTLPPLPRRAPDGKIRIGYFSADFREHPVADLMLGLFERHDRSRFHLVGFAFGPNAADRTTERVAATLDEFIDIRQLSDIDAALLAREKQIGIAVDLGGYTRHDRPGIFALRAAPVQVNYIGFLGTLGVEHIDYIFADPIIVPAAGREHYAEKIAYLPSYQSNPNDRPVPEQMPTRAACGLPETGFVFCCFNNTYKILPHVFARWIRIVQATPNSALWLYVSNPAAADNLRAEAARLGLEDGRLILAGHVERAEYFARLAIADLFLDTLPYNAGTTASDALWMGLPVLTQIGETFAGRVAASVLTAIGLTDLIATSDADYERIAIELGNDPAQLADAKERLARNRRTERLFDTKRFAASVEAAYEAMMDRYWAGLPPDHIVVPN